MKGWGKWLGYGGMLSFFMAACFKPPDYSPIPNIVYESVIFKDVPDNSTDATDSLILTVRFKDGDGDLGLSSADTLEPFHNRSYFVFSDGSLITYKTKRENPYYDTLPAYVRPYDCINWEIRTIKAKTDTFYFQLNPNHYNIFVRFFVKSNDGTFKEFKWAEEFAAPQCGITLDGRFPILSKDLRQDAALEGKIRYAMTSSGFLFLFSIKPLKLRITIQDRHLNKSNTVETQEFTLQQIKKSG